MLDTSRDILFIILALCALWLTVFVSWLLYYCIKIVRNASRALDSVQERLRGIEEAVRMVKEKIENASSSLKVVVESAALVVKYILNRRARMQDEDAKEEGDDFFDGSEQHAGTRPSVRKSAQNRGKRAI